MCAAQRQKKKNNNTHTHTQTHTHTKSDEFSNSFDTSKNFSINLQSYNYIVSFSTNTYKIQKHYMLSMPIMQNHLN